MRLTVLDADITTLEVDAIVNAANGDLTVGGGVCGAIFRAAGPHLAEACRPLAPCPTGGARVTPGFALKAPWIIHTVGPVWTGGDAGEEAALAECYRASLSLAEINACNSIAFPAISTGIYGFPPERAAPIAVRAVEEAEAELGEVIFCCFGAESAALHRAAIGAFDWRARGRLRDVFRTEGPRSILLVEGLTGDVAPGGRIEIGDFSAKVIGLDHLKPAAVGAQSVGVQSVGVLIDGDHKARLQQMLDASVLMKSPVPGAQRGRS